MTYSIIIDIITLLVGVFIVYASYKKGFIRSIILVIGYVLSIFVAIYLSKMVSTYIFDNFISDFVIRSINDTISANSGDLSAAVIFPLILANLPKFITNPIIGGFGGEAELFKLIDDKTNGVIENFGTVITEYVAQPIMLSMLKIISCLIIFILCTIIVRIVANMLNVLFSIPIVGSLNSVLGGLLGIVQTGIIYYIANLAISAVISLTAGSLPYLNNEVMSSTYILKLFM